MLFHVIMKLTIQTSWNCVVCLLEYTDLTLRTAVTLLALLLFLLRIQLGKKGVLCGNIFTDFPNFDAFAPRDLSFASFSLDSIANCGTRGETQSFWMLLCWYIKKRDNYSNKNIGIHWMLTMSMSLYGFFFWFDICIYYGMITKISLVSIHHHTVTNFFLVVRKRSTFKIHCVSHF